MDIRTTSIRQIERAILTRKNEVINALRKSKVNVSDNISDNMLLDAIMYNLKVGNGYLISFLTKVIVLDEAMVNSKNYTTPTLAAESATDVAIGLYAWLENLQNRELVQLQAKNAAQFV